MTSKCKTCGELEEQHLSNKQCVPLSFIGKEGKFQPEDVPDCEKYDKDILGKHTLTKQKKGSSEDVPKEIINSKTIYKMKYAKKKKEINILIKAVRIMSKTINKLNKQEEFLNELLDGKEDLK